MNTAVSNAVYVIDDEPQVLDALRMQLTTLGYAVRAYLSARQFLDDMPELTPGVVITDQRMPEIEGLGVQQKLRRRNDEFALILISGYPETRIAVEAMRAGAVTVLDKPYEPEDMKAAVAAAFQHLREAGSRGHEPQIPAAHLLDQLTQREREVIRFVYFGKTNRAIGILLGIHSKTVEKHRGNGMRKLGARSLPELMRILGGNND